MLMLISAAGAAARARRAVSRHERRRLHYAGNREAPTLRKRRRRTYIGEFDSAAARLTADPGFLARLRWRGTAPTQALSCFRGTIMGDGINRESAFTHGGKRPSSDAASFSGYYFTMMPALTFAFSAAAHFTYWS